MSVPHLIHVGFPKCGSTWLQHWFGQHPEVAYCWDGFGGEHGVNHFLERFIHPDPRIRCRVTSEERLIVPADTAKFSQVDMDEIDQRRGHQVAIARELARRYPDALVLMVTRNHADLMRSGFSQHVRQGSRATVEDLGSVDIDRFLQSGLFDFDFAIDLYRGLFGERILILPMEWLADDPQGFVDAIAGFAGIAPMAPLAKPVNPSLTPEELYWYPRMAKLLARIKPGRLWPKLLRLHLRAIERGWWDPAVALLRLVAGKRSARLDIPPELLEQLALTCRNLVTLPHYQPYRDRYLNRPE